MKTAALAISMSMATITGWHDLPALPQALGGQTAGMSHGALLVVGGSRFDRPPYDGGTKEWVDTLHVLAAGETAWRSFPLGVPRAYACAVSYGEAVYVVGGANAKGPLADVLRIEWLEERPRLSAAPALPRPLMQHGCALSGSLLYVVGGQSHTDEVPASASLQVLDLAAQEQGWRELPPLPGAGRILPVCGALGSGLHVFGGAELRAGPNGQVTRRYLRDGWRFEPGVGWRTAAPLPRAVVAAPAVALSKRTLAVFGGDDGALDGRMAELRERHPGFPRGTLLFDADRGVWQEGEALPVSLVTTAAVLRNGHVVIAGGEDRPGHRSARVLTLEAQALTAKAQP